MAIQDANQGVVKIDTFKGDKAVIKGVKHPDVPVLRELEWWMLRREVRALKTLEELPRIPDFLGFPKTYSFAMEHCEGQTLREIDPDILTPDFFKELAELVRAVHAHGIVHSDLKRKENIMVSPSQEPILIDWGTSFQFKPGFHPVNNWFYRQFKQIDLNAVSKLKDNYCSELVEPEDKQRLQEPVFLEKFSRFGRKYILFRE